MKSFLHSLFIVAFLFTTIQCSSTRHMPAISSLSVDDPVFQFSDATVEEAFNQKPQIRLPLKMAIYDVSFESMAIADSLEAFIEIHAVSHISPAMIEGDVYYKRLSNPWYSYNQPTPKTDSRHLRTLAAQSHSDLILFFGTHHTVHTDANLLAITYFGLVPMFFVPGNRIEVNSYIDMYIIDVRNGFVYSSYRNHANSKNNFVKLSNEREVNQLKQGNIQQLTNGFLSEIKRVLHRTDFQIHDL